MFDEILSNCLPDASWGVCQRRGTRWETNLEVYKGESWYTQALALVRRGGKQRGRVNEGKWKKKEDGGPRAPSACTPLFLGRGGFDPGYGAVRGSGSQRGDLHAVGCWLVADPIAGVGIRRTRMLHRSGNGVNGIQTISLTRGHRRELAEKVKRVLKGGKRVSTKKRRYKKGDRGTVLVPPAAGVHRGLLAMMESTGKRGGKRRPVKARRGNKKKIIQDFGPYCK